MRNQRSIFSRRLQGFAPPLLVAGATLSLPAHAQLNSDVIRPVVGLSVNYDSNVLGLTGPEQALAVTGRNSLSDTSRTLYAGLMIDKPVGRQVLSANVSANSTKFDRLTPLDYSGHDASLGWAWVLGNSFDGKLGINHVATLAPFTDFHSLERNTYTTDRRFASGIWHVLSDWRVHAGIARYDVDYALAVENVFDRKETQGELGFDYATASGNLAGLQYRFIDGKLPNQPLGPDKLDNDYHQGQIEFKSTWQFANKTKLDVVGGWVSRTHDVYKERDFRGGNGRMTLVHALTPNLTFTGAAWRETGIFDDVSTAYSTNRGLSLTGRWSVTGKLTLEGIARREHRDYTRSALQAALPHYSDVIRMNQLALTYMPLQRVNIQLTVFSTGKSPADGFDAYSRHGATLSTRYQF